MNCVGIIAEYNPFHNGHHYQLQEAKRISDCECAAVVISGNFVERGDVAVYDKFTRTKWALENGADIVFELPLLFSLASAQRFARGACGILNASGLVSSLCFGAETDDIELLKRTADFLNSDSTKNAAAHIATGCSYPAALARMLNDAGINNILTPNNILGIEYISALNHLFSAIHPVVIKRLGAAHDSSDAAESFSSASNLRAILSSDNISRAVQFVPKNVFDDMNYLHKLGCPASLNNISDCILYALRRMSIDEIRSLPDVTEGLENVIYRAARESTSYEQLIMAVKSKRYTLARIRRIMLHAYIGITANTMRTFDAPLYIRVLGIKHERMNLFSELAAKSSLPIITRFSDTKALSTDAHNMLKYDILASDLYAGSLSIKSSCKNDFKAPLIIVK